MTESAFIKPERVVVDVLAYLSEVLKNGLKKDLQEHQILCPTCKGTGLAITNSVYGLSNDPDKSKHFPYSNQYIVSCQHCYGGVINLCEYCKAELPRFTTKCDCDKAKSVQYSLQLEKERESWNKAIKLEHDDEIAKGMGMYYSEEFPSNDGYFTEWEDFIDRWNDDHPDEEKPQYVWGTYSMKLTLDADSILESACDDLHEEAWSNIDDKDELQNLLDKWSKKQTGTETYYSDTKYAIKIPW
ncbi:hypothetical protein BSK59_14040 [Paenibacillus odorifer]|uniref:hypothetical protein n=1 Tax=Paenibacillus odorifer TaxID=189426 RepID=UPI00096E5CC6|nr:hypothetical protein [Paenibacillus odorifer]OME55589.1 hypothetical protein BSK59_14040 [Paenibacillus odorifer]